MLRGCTSNFRCAILGFSNSNPRVVELPIPSSPSQVLGFGDAMSAGKSIILLRTFDGRAELTFLRRNYHFLKELILSYNDKAEFIELPMQISFEQNDYITTILDNFFPYDFAVMKKEGAAYTMHLFPIVISESYEEAVLPAQKNLEGIFGRSGYSKEKLLSPTSQFEPYNKAMRERRNLIIYSFDDCCGSFPPSQQEKLENQLIDEFSSQAELLKISTYAPLDPAFELLSKTRNIVNVYNAKTGKISPALFSGQDVLSNVRKFLSE